MQADTVCLNLYDYDNLKKKERDYIEANNTIRKIEQNYEFQLESLNDNIAKLHEYILKKSVSEYRLEQFELEMLLDESQWEFLFHDCMKELLDLGITIKQMKEFITCEKYLFDNQKEQGKSE